MALPDVAPPPSVQVDPAGLGLEACYKLLSGLVVPRPIAWVSTRGASGVVNLAPFSCYTFVSSKPPLLGINIGLRAGAVKDTLRNVLESRCFVVNVGDATQAQALHCSADEFGPEVSEPELLGLPLTESVVVPVPRLRDVPAAMECRLHSQHAFGEAGSVFVVGEVVQFHFRPGVCVDGKIDTAALNPLGRIAGLQYCATGELITLPPIRRSGQGAAVPPAGTG